jgi:hypothetical protein
MPRDLKPVIDQVVARTLDKYPGVRAGVIARGDTRAEAADTLADELAVELARLFDLYPWGLAADVVIDGMDPACVVVTVSLGGVEITTDCDLRSSGVDPGPHEVLRVRRRAA